MARRNDPPPDPTDAWVKRNRFDTYLSVLVLLVATFMFGMAAPNDGWARFTDVALQGLTLTVTLRVSRARPRVQRVLDIVVALAIVSAAVNWFGGSNVGDGIIDLMSGVLVAAGPYVIYRGVGRRTLRVDLETVAAAICVYVMIGLFFAYVFAAIGTIDPPFFQQVDDATRADYLYYSFITLATVGYGDFTSSNDLGRAISVSEAILGQMYLVTVVALVVSNIGRERRRPGEAIADGTFGATTPATAPTPPTIAGAGDDDLPPPEAAAQSRRT